MSQDGTNSHFDRLRKQWLKLPEFEQNGRLTLATTPLAYLNPYKISKMGGFKSRGYQIVPKLLNLICDRTVAEERVPSNQPYFLTIFNAFV